LLTHYKNLITLIKVQLKNGKLKTNYWQNAERTNGRMAMMGFFALVVNYVLFDWIIPGVF
tara:strand:- start:530 stop:709 length:180 start_codon:yes stop_codon:yes gene_type:complete